MVAVVVVWTARPEEDLREVKVRYRNIDGRGCKAIAGMTTRDEGAMHLSLFRPDFPIPDSPTCARLPEAHDHFLQRPVSTTR